ncbi:hypothetical protein GCM10010168_78620 [Actinoplanes ianthinogenes]|uniref:Mycothiol-dependent maleylpyruvate isomerase metal-binding domain-containing protein n=1 Tax=Actinoplanes ianthinogenes TaxID=122358 RepID=A0ABM7LKA5_9ACTN|nr:maleylpyruvate isomerase family mycothiol-dependent enzyme [Actinoplanes ianthinogenes]BCJ39682.1 hypothetical protein Aiant_03390 [Actinoplanes ianthinogenes]GGR48151.1 hypothetical protein GCM10010168_78620 [Actinoplanes ianthinogenes]
MTTSAERTIAALRAEHDSLAATGATLSADRLKGPSGASDWTVAQVFSHLGSGAEITLAGLRAATGVADAPGPDFNQRVWDRWNAMSPEAQAAGAVESDAALVAAFESLTPEQHETLRINPGFLPAPAPLATFAGLRLSETVHHGWDIRVATDPAARLSPESAELLAEHLNGGLSFFLGFIAKPEAIGEPAVVQLDGTPYRIVLDDSAHFTSDGATATAVFTGPLESALRLIVGRLAPEHTPSGVEVAGNVTLDGLRAVFPGF